MNASTAPSIGAGAIGRSAVRTIAAFEALKGLVALAAAFGLLHLMHRDLSLVAESFVRHAHLDPSGRFPQVLVGWATKLGDMNAWGVFAVALLYVTLRLSEAWGLWWDRAWGEWIGALSGVVYLPLEIHHLIHRPTALSWAIFLLNVAIIGLLVVRLRQRRSSGAAQGQPSRGPETPPTGPA